MVTQCKAVTIAHTLRARPLIYPQAPQDHPPVAPSQFDGCGELQRSAAFFNLNPD